MAAPRIKIRALCKNFGPANVLNGINLDIEPSQINFIIGQSGGGKSVLLKHLVGLMHPDSGEIWYDKREMVNGGQKAWQAIRNRMAILFQDGALFDSMSVGENVGFPLWVKKLAPPHEIARKAQARLNDLELAKAFHKRPSELSTGERKRVALARALIIEPDLLFFDEPTTGLDPILSEQVDDLIMMTLKRTRATVVVVSHDIKATLSLAHKISMIYDGKIILSGEAEIFRQTQNPVVRQFLAGDAEGPMGFLD
ncbi:MAG: ABC transporter ATP-binding protein [Candidatus Adiutrix sp.]